MPRSSPGRATRPAVATPHVLGRTTGTLYAAGGLAVLLAALAAPAASTVLLVVSATALLTGALVLRWGDRLPHGAFHALVAAGSGLITVGVLAAPSALTAVLLASIYTFVAIDVFYYFRGAAALAQLGLLLALAGWATASRGVEPLVVASLAVVLVAVAVAIGDLAARASSAARDPLTGLLNRRSFEQAVEAAAAEAERTGSPLVLALLDVDHFKDVNDSRGHAAGDDLLKALAQLLRQHLPADARVARLGGDEFAVLLTRTGEAQALEVLEAARRVAGHPISLGAAGRLAGEPTSELARRADAALYRAKQLGRDRSVMADAASGHLARDLASALLDPSGGGLRVVLQPVVAVTGQDVIAVEALLRWDHPLRGPVPPAEFVGVAERAGLVPALGALALRRACADLALLRERLPDLVLTVNASGYELLEPDYADRLLAVLQQRGLPPSALVVEVTESVVEGTSPEALLTVARLREAGVRVAVDDFGAGYSSFSRLSELPADFLKLDGALLDGATASPRRRALLEVAISAGAAIGLEVVVEGVETADQAALLRELGCPMAQGFHYGRPLPAADLLALWGADRPGAPVHLGGGTA
jgi:diguanylate cyclase (GGDEF)-like protein